MERWMDRLTDMYIYGQMDGQLHGRSDLILPNILWQLLVFFSQKLPDVRKGGHTDSRTNTQME